MSIFNAVAVLKRIAFAAAITTLLTPGLAAAKRPVNDAEWTYGTTTSKYLSSKGVSVNALGKTTKDGGGRSPTTFDFPISSIGTSSDGTKLYAAYFSGANISFSRGYYLDEKFTNLRYDLAKNILYGDEEGSKKKTAIFQGTSITGGQLSNGSFEYIASGLKLTEAANAYISKALSISTGVLANVDFGSIRIQAVPEPVSLGLLGLGAVVVAGVSARRRQVV